MLHVQLLGEVTAVRDGAPVPLSAAHRRLLAFLALHPGPHAREALAARFWPDASRARANLRTAVWTLHQALGPDVVLATREAVGLGPVARDLDDLDRDGEPCPDLDDDWAEAARADHRARRLARLDALVAEAHDPAAAAVWAASRCALTPLDEAAHRVLIEKLAAAGDRAGALVVGRDLGARLRAELGVAPGPATRALLARLHGSDRGDTRPGSRRPMFGRGRELAALSAAWTAARNGHGQVVLIVGEAGIGKTRLVGELARRADNVGARVAVGAGLDVGGEAPLAMWQELARALVAVVPVPPESVGWPAELGRLAPDLAGALGRRTAPPVVAAPELERLRLFDAVLRLVEWAAAERPVLLVAEDLHRSDRASLALCAHIGRRLADLPVLFVLTRRDRPDRPDADALLADLAGRGLEVTRIELGPLTSPEVAEVARSVAALGDGPLAQVVATAEGNPLLAVESARALAGGSAAPPPNLRAVVRTAVGRLPDAARALAEAVAAAGRTISVPELAALRATPDAEHHVLDSGMTRRIRGGIAYRHALLAEAARADLRDPHGTHLTVALAVEAAADHGDAGAAEVARHLQLAGRNDLAAPRWARAARHARSLGALPEAVAFWTEAVRCEPGDAGTRMELAEAYSWSGRATEFEREWEAALALASSAEQPALWCRRGLLFKTVACNPAASLAAYRRADALLRPDAAPDLQARVLLGLAWNEATAGDPARSEPLLARSGALLPEPDDETQAEIETIRLITAIRVGRFAECEALARRAGTVLDRVLRPDFAYVVWIMAACALACAGGLDAALRTAERGVAATRNVPVVALPCLAARAHLLARMGRHDEASRAVGELQATAERLDSAPLLALARHDAGLVALVAGRLREAADLLGAALDGQAAVSRPATRLARAEALAGAGEPDEAAAELRRATMEPVGLADQAWALVPQVARVQGLIARARGDHAQARRRLTESADGWHRRAGTARGVGHEYMAALVDLGRPPVVGLVEPERELARVAAELAELEKVCPGSR